MATSVADCEAELSRLRTRVALLEAALNEINDHVAIVDLNRNFVFVNRAIQESLGREINAAGLDENLAQVETRDQSRAVPIAMADAFSQALSGTRTEQISTWMRDKQTGRDRYLVGDIRPLKINGQVQAAMVLSRDLTEQQAAEDRLAWERERFELVAQGSSSGIWDWNVATNETFLSDQYLALLGYQPHESSSAYSTWSDALHPDEREHVFKAIQDSFEERKKYDIVYRLRTKSGDYRWFRASGAVKRDVNGRVVRMAGTITDIHEQRLAEEALRASEERFREFMNHSPTIQWIKDADGRFVYVNRTFEKHFQMLSADMIGKTDADFWSPEAAAQYVNNDRLVLQGGKTVELMEQSRDPDGTIRHWMVCKFLLHDSAGNPYTGGIGLDVTAQKLTEEELRRSREKLEQRVQERTHELAQSNVALRNEIADRLKAERTRNQLLSTLVTIEEDQRRRISRELHDEFGQLVVGLGMGLLRLREASPLGTTPCYDITKLQAIVEQMGTAARHIAAEIRPTALDDHGLLAALENYTSQWAVNSDIVVDLEHFDVSPEQLSVPVATAVYRIVQEALTNVAKHARATRVGLVLRQVDQVLSLIVEDNGIGMASGSESDVNDDQWGLRGIHERVEVLGGSFEVESAPGNGTTLFIKLPLN
jgi:PAS domain S-box-containing protein